MNAPSILGIDPGMKGALALYRSATPHQTILADIPVSVDGGIDARALNALILMLKEAAPGMTAVVELVHSLPRQAGAFAFGLSTGIIHGILAANDVPFTLVSPQAWKGTMGLRKRHEESTAQFKDRSRALATQLLPSHAKEFSRKKDDGRAEAFLLAVYYAFHKASEEVKK